MKPTSQMLNCQQKKFMGRGIELAPDFEDYSTPPQGRL
jgi:hypothetical protein